MSVFAMCEECSGEYHDPKDRRFHAQPNACPKCGPHITFTCGRKSAVGDQAMEKTVACLKEGKIVAIKGLGGFHIACDAENREAVEKLRERKRRSNKPFALMAPDIERIGLFCEVSEEEKRLLLSNRRPIVLLRKRSNRGYMLPEALSPNNSHFGFMLPYTPLHYLLFRYPLSKDRPSVNCQFRALVMTSGNLSEEPIVKNDDEAMEKLSALVDAVLFHNRDIFMRVDDSVLRVGRRACSDSERRQGVDGDVRFIRRSRGYAPEPIRLETDGPEVMGCGADLKNTFTVTKGSFAIPSQHIGDMENYETLRFFEECLENIKAIYRAKPVAIGHDLHPGYLSTQWALRQVAEGGEGVETFGIQHHYAHMGAAMAEHGLARKVMGVILDGTGYGTDGNLWGGEFLVADIDGFERAGHFRYIPLPGGEAAIRAPWKTAISYVSDAAGNEVMDYLKAAGFVERYGKEAIASVLKVRNVQKISPLSSGAGRLFDAVSALIGLCDRNTFEGEAAISLESLIGEETEEAYPVNIILDGTASVHFSQTIIGIIHDIEKGEEKELISCRFHNTISNVILRLATWISGTYGLKDVVLSGGTFQNMYLLRRTMALLNSAGMNVFLNRSVPCNDACISLGQAYLVRERVKKGHATVLDDQVDS
jgi:hydrogenase maturation protein HypF